MKPDIKSMDFKSLLELNEQIREKRIQRKVKQMNKLPSIKRPKKFDGREVRHIVVDDDVFKVVMVNEDDYRVIKLMEVRTWKRQFHSPDEVVNIIQRRCRKKKVKCHIYNVSRQYNDKRKFLHHVVNRSKETQRERDQIMRTYGFRSELNYKPPVDWTMIKRSVKEQDQLN